MPGLSKWMIGLGLLLIICDLANSVSSVRLGPEGMVGMALHAAGPTMLLSGLAVTQGRRSLRLTGQYVGIFLPLLLSAVFVWHAIRLWRGGLSPLPPLAMIALAGACMVVSAAVIRSRPRECIASRGYAVTVLGSKPESLRAAEIKTPTSKAG